jgi:hypothetical protein
VLQLPVLVFQLLQPFGLAALFNNARQTTAVLERPFYVRLVLGQFEIKRLILFDPLRSWLAVLGPAHWLS